MGSQNSRLKGNGIGKGRRKMAIERREVDDLL